MRRVLVTAPTEEPVTVAEVKLHCRIDGTAEDDYLEALITSARQHVENVTGRALLTQTWDYSLDGWPHGTIIPLPFGNLQSVTSVKWKDQDGTETTLTAEGPAVSDPDYIVVTSGDKCGAVALPYAGTWPTGTLYPHNPITIRFVCGWTTPTLIPAPIKAAILMTLTDLYENREAQLVGSMTQAYSVNQTVKALLASYRLWDAF